MIMFKSLNKTTGKIGEDYAAELLDDKGYKILERNWGDKWGEIDIICRDKDIFVFVEVKTKMGLNYGSPEEMINYRKLTQIKKIASLYPPARVTAKRIDVVAVVLSEDRKVERINHYENVY